MRRRNSRLILAVTCSLVVSACAASDPDGEGAQIVSESSPEPSTSESPEETPAPSESADSAETSEAPASETAAGTRQNPLQPGTRAGVGDYEVAVVSVSPDATSEVMQANEFNTPPAEGRQFVMASLDLAYVGQDSGTPAFDLTWKVLGTAGNTFGTGTDDLCGVIPSDLVEVGEMFPDATANGNVCVSVPSDQVAGGAIILEDLFQEDRTFWSIP